MLEPTSSRGGHNNKNNGGGREGDQETTRQCSVRGEGSGGKHYAKILAVEIAPSEIAEYLERRARELGVILVLSRRY